MSAMTASMAATQEAFGPSVGPIPARSFEAQPATSSPELDRKLGRLREQAREFARLPIAKKVELLEDIHRRTYEVSTEWVRAACNAKGISLDAPVAGEEW